MLREALIVTVLGVGLALGANAFRSNGLDLSRDYFFAAGTSADAPGLAEPGPTSPGATDPGATKSAAGGASTPEADAGGYVEHLDPNVVARLASQGLSVMPHDEALATFEDPAYAMGMFVFVDARDDAHFSEGHIPGAVQFDHYQQDRFLETVLPVVTDPMVAKVVVYCKGGDCEDSEFAAMNLMVRGVDRAKLFVYVGGYEAWTAAGLPLETSDP